MELTICLSEASKAYIEDQVSSGKYPDASAFIEDLIRWKSIEKAREKIEALVLEGMESGEPIPWTTDSLAKLKESIARRHAAKATNEPPNNDSAASLVGP